MTAKARSAAPRTSKPDVSLTKVLGQNEQVKDLVEEAADDLSSLKVDLKQNLARERPPAAVDDAIKKSEAAENKVLRAADKLTVINEELESEVHELHALQQKFAATLDQAETSRQAALHDVLTGLPNRALFRDRLEHGLEQAQRHGWTLAVLFIDLDGFKKINDAHGHAVGDGVLKAIASRLRLHARADDTVSRHGGDEFLCLLMGSGDALDISPIAASIIRVIEQPLEKPEGNFEGRLQVSASIGIAVYPQDGNSADALIRSADAAMYKAKYSRSGFLFASGGSTQAS